MARQIIFHKYQGRENGFLIYDIRKNEGEMDDKMMHMIQSRNFGMYLHGILVGPYLINGSLQMRLYDGKGNEIAMRKENRDIPATYMEEAGYVTGDNSGNRQRPEKIYCWC